MRAESRRKEIVVILSGAKKPVSGGELSERLHASRQIIVQDVAYLRTVGYDILSTHTGYVMKASPLVEHSFKVYHTSEQTADELRTIVELGGTVVNVYVWHKVYGRLEAPLNLFSLQGVEQFMEGLKNGRSTELMHITSGYHFHTVRATSEDILRQIEQALGQKGYLAADT